MHSIHRLKKQRYSDALLNVSADLITFPMEVVWLDLVCVL